MPRRGVSFEPGGMYHLYNRAVAGEKLFREPENYRFFTARLLKYASELNVQLLAYCLMSNHFHLFVRQDSENPAGSLPAHVCNSYSKAYNRRYARAGALLQGRYRAEAVQDDAQAQYLCAYIHANPVWAGLVHQPQDWPYSDARNWLEASDGPAVLGLGLFPEGFDYGAFLESVIDRKIKSS